MKKFTIELDETICEWLNRVSQVTGEPIEKLISKGISNQVIALEDEIFKCFVK